MNRKLLRSLGLAFALGGLFFGPNASADSKPQTQVWMRFSGFQGGPATPGEVPPAGSTVAISDPDCNSSTSQGCVFVTLTSDGTELHYPDGSPVGCDPNEISIEGCMVRIDATPTRVSGAVCQASGCLSTTSSEVTGGYAVLEFVGPLL